MSVRNLMADADTAARKAWAKAFASAKEAEEKAWAEAWIKVQEEI